VIGGGIADFTTAYALTSLDMQSLYLKDIATQPWRHPFANEGQLCVSNAEVWKQWATVLKGLKWRLKSDSPLLLNLPPNWRKLIRVAEFIGNLPISSRNTIKTTRLAIAAREHMFAWAHAEGVDFDLKKEGILHLHRNRKGFDHAGEVSKLLAQTNLPRREGSRRVDQQCGARSLSPCSARGQSQTPMGHTGLLSACHIGAGKTQSN